MRFSTSLGRSLARALQLNAVSSPAVTDVAPSQPAWIGRIPAELVQRVRDHSARFESVENWPQLVRQMSVLAEPELSAAISVPAPLWWSELERELELRSALVQEQWEIRGPGLLGAIARRLGPAESSGALQIELVLPLQGGAGQYLGDGRAWLEALLHDVSPHFPETLRVGWLVACQLRSESAAARRLLLEAAADVEWLSDDPLTESALQSWLEGCPAPDAVVVEAPRQKGGLS